MWAYCHWAFAYFKFKALDCVLRVPETFLKPIKPLLKMHDFQAKIPFFSFLFSQVDCVVLTQRFYEVNENKKPECGMEMVLVALEDWLRVSTDAHTPPVAPSVCLWSRWWQYLSQMMMFPSLFCIWGVSFSGYPGTGSFTVQCKIHMLCISFLFF